MRKLNLLLFICIVAFSIYTCFYCNKNLTNFRFSLMGLTDIEALGNNEGETGRSCTTSYDCIDSFGNKDGGISCTGTVECKRGIEKSGIFIITEKRWVECDGLRSYC